jgi:hypothetical protein
MAVAFVPCSAGMLGGWQLPDSIAVHAARSTAA